MAETPTSPAYRGDELAVTVAVGLMPAGLQSVNVAVVFVMLVIRQRRERALLGCVGCLVESTVLYRGIRRQEAAMARLAAEAQLVHPLWHRRTLVRQRDRVTMIVDRSERLVHLDVSTVR